MNPPAEISLSRNFFGGVPCIRDFTRCPYPDWGTLYLIYMHLCGRRNVCWARGGRDGEDGVRQEIAAASGLMVACPLFFVVIEMLYLKRQIVIINRVIHRCLIIIGRWR